MKLPFKTGETILFIGDSISDAGRTNHLPPFGGGFIAMFRNMVLAKEPELDLTFINMGISANTLEGLEYRWDRDVLDYDPDHLFIMIGINDVVIQSTSSRSNEDVLLEFKERFHKLIYISTLKNISSIYLMTPFFISDDQASVLSTLCIKYGNIVKDIAKEFHLRFIDINELFRSQIRTTSHSYWSGDGIHPYDHGHYLIADTLYRELCCE